MRKKLLYILALFAFGVSAQEIQTQLAPSTELTKKTSDIVNPQLRADQGSMSKLSLSSSMSYSGPSMKDPFGDTKPNPNNWTGNYDTSLSGSLSARYRFSKATSAKLGVGFIAFKPFHGMESVDLKNPDASIAFTKKFEKFTMNAYTALTHYTEETDRVKLAKREKWEAGNTLKWDHVFGSNFTPGLKIDGANYFYGRGVDYKKDKRSTAYYYNIKPIFEYRLSKMFVLSTDFTFGYSHYRTMKESLKFERNKIQQTIGLGTAFTPEVYLYAYLATYPEQYRADETSLSFSLTMSVF